MPFKPRNFVLSLFALFLFTSQSVFSQSESVENTVVSGAITHNSARITTQLTGAASVRMQISTDSVGFNNPAYSNTVTANANADYYVTVDITGLSSATRYYYRAEIDGIIQTDEKSRGRFKTFGVGPYSFSFGFASCAASNSNSEVFTAIKDENLDFYINTGDLTYDRIESNCEQRFINAYGKVYSASNRAALYRHTPFMYMWDDNDYGPNNSGAASPCKTDARIAYQRHVPHYPLEFGSGDVPISQSFVVGRVRIIMSDLRSEKVPPIRNNCVITTPGTNFGPQLTWFYNELLDAKANGQAVVWVSGIPYYSDEECDNDDGWGGYPEERTAIANFVRDNNISICVISGDRHRLAIDDGTNTDYATGGGAPIPYFLAAVLDKSSGGTSRPYSHGVSNVVGQFGRANITDNGGNTIDVEWIGIDSDNNIVSANGTGNPVVHNFTLDVQPSGQPTVSITNPPADTIYSTVQPITIEAIANDPDGTVSQVEFFVDGSSIGVDFSAPYSASWTFPALGTYAIYAEVTDDSANTASSTQINISALQQPPVASFTATPSGGYPPFSSSFNASGSSDPDGSIVSYTWDFGDGNFGSGITVNHNYTTLGNFTASLIVTDDQGLSDTTTLPISSGLTPTNFLVQITNSSDDAEERLSSGNVNLTSSDIELGFDGSNNQLLALRFPGLSIPQGATIQQAYIQFVADEVDTDPTQLTIRTEAVDNAPTYVNSNSYLSTRTLSTASVSWSPNPWNAIGDAGADQQSADLSTIIQEIIDRPGWTSDNALSFILSGTGERTAEATDGNAPQSAPKLFIEYLDIPDVAPTVVFTQPTDSATFLPLDTVFISANANDAFATVSQVAFQVNGVNIGTDLTAPYEVKWVVPATGSYTIRAEATDDTGNIGADTLIVLGQSYPPVASFVDSPNVGPFPLEVYFDADSSSDSDGSIVTFAWNFGDGSPLDSGINIVHTYNSLGTFTPSLIVTDDQGLTDTLFSTITTSALPPIAIFVDSPSVGPPPLNVSFDADSSYDQDGDSLVYAWDFGDGSIGSGMNVIHSYDSLGIFAASLIVTDIQGLSDTAITTISVLITPPVAAFIDSNTVGPPPLLVSFDADSSYDSDGMILTYAWDFGDGSPLDSGLNVSHTYDSIGNFSPTLIVTDNNGLMDTTSSSVEVKVIAPVAVINDSNTVGPPPLLVSFDADSSYDSDGTILTYAWDFGDGSPLDSGLNVSHTYDSIGNFSPTLIVTDNNGLMDTTSSSVEVKIIAPVAVINDSNTVGPPPLLVSFDADSSYDSDGTILTYAWDFGDGSPLDSGLNVSHTYDSLGNFSPTLIVTDNNGLMDTTSSSVEVKVFAPVAVINDSNTVGPPPLLVSFDADSSYDSDGTILTYAWDFGDGSPLDSGLNVSHTYDSIGNFSPTLIVTDNNGLMDTTSSSVEVDANAPIASFSASPNSGPYPLDVVFDAKSSTSANGIITTYAWDLGDGTLANGDSITHTYTTLGNFTATLIVTSSYGLSDTTSQIISTSSLSPTAVIDASSISGPPALVVDFSATNSSDPDGTITSYVWDFGDGGIAAGDSVSHTYSVIGTYQASLIVTDNQGLSDTTNETITVFTQAPIASMVANPTNGSSPLLVNFDGSGSTDLDGTIITYAWNFGDGILDTASIVTHTYSSPGTFTASLIVTDNHNLSDTVTQLITVTQLPPTAAFTASTTSGPNPLAVTFDGSSSSDPDGTLVGYFWNFGNGVLDTGSTVNYTYMQVGTFSAALIVEDSQGLRDTVAQTITVTELPPTAVLSANPTSGSAPLIVALDGSNSTDSDGTIAAYSWNMGDGNTGSGANISHTYMLAGNYLATLIVTDSQGLKDTVTQLIQVQSAPTSSSIAINSFSDDAEERTFNNKTLPGGSDLELGYDGSREQLVGLRFNGIPVPQGATITSASVQFTADENDNDPTNFTIVGEAADNPATYQNIYFDLSGRSQTSAQVSWSPASWSIGNAGPAQQTPDISTIIQEIVDRPGWVQGNSLAIVITGTGERTAESYDADPALAAVLSVEFVDIPDGTPTVALTSPNNGTVFTNFQPITLSANANDPDGTISQVEFSINGIPVGTSFNSPHSISWTPSTDGSFVVSATATDNLGNIATDNRNFSIQVLAPFASFTATPDAGAPALAVSFDASGSSDPDGSIVSYDWTFGDGNTASGQLVNHTYLIEGTYSAQLIITDDQGLKDTATTSIIVQIQPPVASITTSLSTTSPGTLISFDGSGSTDPDGSIVTYAWDFGDGTQATGVNVNHSYAADGSYTTQLIITDDQGLSDTATTSIIIQIQPPVASFSASLSTTSPGTIISFDGSGSTDPDGSILTYAWDFGDGMQATGVNVNHSYAAVGNYTTQLIITDDQGLSDTATTSITIQVLPPVASFTANPEMGAAPLIVNFDANGSSDPDGNIVTYTWDFGDGNFGTGITIDNTYALDGDYLATLIITDDQGLSDTSTTTISVGSVTLNQVVSVSQNKDDAEERLENGKVSLGSSDLEIGYDGSREQHVGIRFNGINVPQGETVTEAYIQFTADEPDAGTANFTIHGEAVDNASIFANTTNNVSSRPRTTANVPWSPADWVNTGDAGAAQQTSNFSSVVQEIINRPGWSQGNSLVILFSGTGERTADSYNASPALAPVLHLSYLGSPSARVGQGEAPIVVEKNQKEEQDQSKIIQIYPNPSSGSFTVQYYVAKAGNYKLAVSDLVGKEVKLLIDGEHTQGYHEISINQPLIVGEGIYLLQLSSGNFVSARKLIIQH